MIPLPKAGKLFCFGIPWQPVEIRPMRERLFQATRADMIGPCHQIGKLSEWFDTSSFAAPEYGAINAPHQVEWQFWRDDR